MVILIAKKYSYPILTPGSIDIQSKKIEGIKLSNVPPFLKFTLYSDQTQCS